MEFDYIFLYQINVFEGGTGAEMYKGKVDELETKVTPEKIKSLFNSERSKRIEIGLEPEEKRIIGESKYERLVDELFEYDELKKYNFAKYSFAPGWSRCTEDEVIELSNEYKCIAIPCLCDF